jgi:Dyp-type peroxidase family
MLDIQPAREAPIKPPLEPSGTPPSAIHSKEEVLALEKIQGNIIGGFRKDHQTMLFLKITGPVQFRAWLATLVPFIATAAEVLAFNRLFKELRRRRGESRAVQSTWVNVALSFSGLKALADQVPGMESVENFKDEAFRQGMHNRAVKELGDPSDEAAEGNPKQWVFGGSDETAADAVVIVASDSPAELAYEVGRIEDSLYSGRTADGRSTNSGARIIYRQPGATLPPPLTGHEHFGFLDGVSQPGLRGLISQDPPEPITPRQNPNDPHQGKPGQDVLWPGEFVFGYLGQNPKDLEEPGINSLLGKDGKPVAPEWAKDGSFLVVRRLRQDVNGFHKFLKAEAAKLSISDSLLGAKLVGRWPSGAPIMRTPDLHDIPKMADDDCANNNFEFQDETKPLPPPSADPSCQAEEGLCRESGEFPTSKGDPAGTLCPWAAHVRKAYPRDDQTEGQPFPTEETTQTHRLLRRGIPYGPPFFPPNDPDRKEPGNRGLVFLAYQTDIVDQFEFVQKNWCNNPSFKQTGAGHDLIIGQNNQPGENRKRTFKLVLGQVEKTLETTQDWVIPTGGGYFFAPSIEALCQLTGYQPEC